MFNYLWRRILLIDQLSVTVPISPVISYSNFLFLNKSNTKETDIMNECCEKSGGKCGCNASGKRKNESMIRKEKLREFLKKYNEKDLRFAYFRSKRNPLIYITAVSVLDRSTCILKVAFAFASPKDAFCRAEGKVKCFTKLETPNHAHVVQVPWLEDGLLSMYLAYNRLKEKPEKLAKSKFDDLVFSGEPNSWVSIGIVSR